MYKIPKSPITYQLFINGQYVDSVSGKKFNRKSPAHDIIVGEYSLANKEDTENAIKVARNAFKDDNWTMMSGANRPK